MKNNTIKMPLIITEGIIREGTSLRKLKIQDKLFGEEMYNKYKGLFTKKCKFCGKIFKLINKKGILIRSPYCSKECEGLNYYAKVRISHAEYYTKNKKKISKRNNDKYNLGKKLFSKSGIKKQW
jgi:hypothetical protein